MTDDLIARLHSYVISGAQFLKDDLTDAADALEAQARRIVELQELIRDKDTLIDLLEEDVKEASKSSKYEAGIAKESVYQLELALTRIAELEAALKPFADRVFLLEKPYSGGFVPAKFILAARAALEKK